MMTAGGAHGHGFTRRGGDLPHHLPVHGSQPVVPDRLPPIRGEESDDWGRLLSRVADGLAVDRPYRRRKAIQACAEAVRTPPIIRPCDTRHAELEVYAQLETIKESADYLMTLIVEYLAERGAPMGPVR